MKQLLQHIRLNRLFQLMTAGVLILLLVITLLGVKQYFLYQHCEQVVRNSNSLLFGFTSIKEHINQTLLTGKQINIGSINSELQAYEKELQHILEDILVPEELKLSLISQLDFIGLVVQLRALQEEAAPQTEQIESISATLRSISSRLQRFDGLLGTYTRSLLFGLHRVIIGTLALVLFLLVSLLLLLNRYISRPLHLLCQAVRRSASHEEPAGEKTCSLSQSIQTITEHLNSNTALHQRLHNLQACLDNVRQSMPTMDIRTPEQWETLCQGLQTNPDYFLIWTGRRPTEGREATVIGCACRTCSPGRCRETVEHLVKFCHQNDGLCRSLRQAMETGKRVCASASFSCVPEQLRSSMPDSEASILMSSFPVPDDSGSQVIVTIYSTTPGCFSPIETTILESFFFQFDRKTGPEKQPPAFPLPSDLYQYAIAGAMAGELTNEITNIVNGSMNYAQALLDLADEQTVSSEQKTLLSKLHEEEQKAAELAGLICRLNQGQEQAAQPYRLALILDEVVRIVQALHKREHITVLNKVDHPLPNLDIDKQAVQTVVLTLLQHARLHVVTTSPRPSDNRQRTITVRSWFDEKQHSVVVRINNCSPQNSLPAPWPSIALCTHLLHQSGGEILIEEPINQPPCCTLTLPVTS